jgi:nitrate reductase beta subunit
MEACIGQVRMQGLVKMEEKGGWAKDPGNPLWYLVHEARVALPLYPQFGTEPNGYYIPPRWVPRPYLRQMFGPGVDAAIEKYEAPDRELLAVLQLFRRHDEVIARYERLPGPKVYEREVRGKKFTLWDDTVVAYATDGRELFRTKVEEPVFERPAIHQNTI